MMSTYLQQIFVIAIAGAVGCIARFLLSQNVQTILGQGFPYGILIVNVSGCLLIGFLSVLLLERLNVGPLWRAGLLIGFLGGFTTFSSFSIDTIKMLENGNYVKAILYIILSVVLSLFATGCGIWLARKL